MYSTKHARCSCLPIGSQAALIYRSYSELVCFCHYFQSLLANVSMFVDVSHKAGLGLEMDVEVMKFPSVVSASDLLCIVTKLYHALVHCQNFT